METYLSLSNNAAGRDKIYRITQYGSKFLSWYLHAKGISEDAVKLVKQLEKNMSTSRKLFRFGRSVESFRAAQRALNLQDYILNVTLTLSHTNKAFYLLIDHYLWLGRVGLLSVDIKKWTDSAMKFWLAALMLAFIRDFYSLYMTTERTLQSGKYESGCRKTNIKLVIVAFVNAMKKNPQATMDIVKNGCDIVIPSTSLGYLNFNNGVVGVCGVISSVIALVQVARPSLKLKPN